MSLLSRSLFDPIKHSLAQGSNIFLFGPAQTGKTTLAHSLSPDRYISFKDLVPSEEKLSKIKAIKELCSDCRHELARSPLILIDGIHHLPELLDPIQLLIQNQIAQFVLIAPNEQSLKCRNTSIDLMLHTFSRFELSPLSLAELPATSMQLPSLLLYGSLPEVLCSRSDLDRKTLLQAFTTFPKSDEERLNQIVQNVFNFSNFVRQAARGSGEILNIEKLSHQLALPKEDIECYYQILEDALIIHRVPAFFQGSEFKKSLHLEKTLFFDLGVRQICSQDLPAPLEKQHSLFKQLVALEILRWLKVSQSSFSLYYGEDDEGLSIDWILHSPSHLIPIDVQWTSTPLQAHAQNLQAFLHKNPSATKGFLVCLCAKEEEIAPNVVAVPWQQLPKTLQKIQELG